MPVVGLILTVQGFGDPDLGLWRHGTLRHKFSVCDVPWSLDVPNVLMVGDSITRHLYSGLVRSLCALNGAQCDGLPHGDVALHGCAHHTLAAPKFNFSYARIHAKASVSEFVRSPTDIVYWQTGLWIIAEHHSPSDIYSKLVREAVQLCNQRKVRRFYLVETMYTAGGTQGNLNDASVSEVNEMLKLEFDKAPNSTEGCLRKVNMIWPLKDRQHIRTDMVHPTADAVASMAPYLWSLFSEVPCVAPAPKLAGTSKPPQNWCEGLSTTTLKTAS